MEITKIIILIIFIFLFNNCGNNNIAQLYDNELKGSISGKASTGSLISSLSTKYAPNNQGQPLTNAEVFAFDYDGNSYGPVYTDSFGNFNMSGLPVSKTHYVIKVKKDKIELKAMIQDVVYGQTTDIGIVDITTTTSIYLLEKRLKDETGQDVKLGTAGFITTDLKTKITEINVEKEKQKLKESLAGDSTANNPIYVVFATITAVLEKANNHNGFSLEEFLKTPGLSVEVEYGDGSTNTVNNDVIDTQIINVKVVSEILVYPDTFIIYQNDTLQLRIIAVFTNGETMNITDSAIYSLSDTSKHNITNGLFLAGIDTGNISLNIMFRGFTKKLNITINQPPNSGIIYYIWEDTNIQPLQSPNLNIQTQNYNYTISWDTINNANLYILQESNNSNFINVLNNYEVYTNNRLFTNKASGNYYYRIKSKNAGYESAWSQTKYVNIPEYGSAIIIW